MAQQQPSIKRNNEIFTITSIRKRSDGTITCKVGCEFVVIPPATLEAFNNPPKPSSGYWKIGRSLLTGKVVSFSSGPFQELAAHGDKIAPASDDRQWLSISRDYNRLDEGDEAVIWCWEYRVEAPKIEQ